jgi:hypothetical protein
MSKDNECVQPIPSVYDKVLAGLHSYTGLPDNGFEIDKDLKMPGGLDQEDNWNTINHGQSRRYGLRPRGAILRVKDPPSWVRHPRAKGLLDEYNLQGAFREEIDVAYQVKEEITVIRKMMDLTFRFFVLLWKFREEIIVTLMIVFISSIVFTVVNSDQIIDPKFGPLHYIFRRIIFNY